jgi:hypothetical protein
MALSDNLEFFADFAAAATGSTTVVDSIGSVSMVPTGGAVIVADGAECDAAGEGFEATTPAGLKLALPLTLACRVKVTATPDDGAGFFGLVHNNSDTNPWYSAEIYSGTGGTTTVRVGLNSGGTFAALISSADVSNIIGVWAVIVAVYTASGITAYLDGVSIYSDATSRSNPTYGATSLVHVGNYTGVSRDSNIILDAAAIWSRALTGTEAGDLTTNFRDALPTGGSAIATIAAQYRRRRSG